MAVCFLLSFLPPLFDIDEFTRDWEDGKASAMTAAWVAFVARCRHRRTTAEDGITRALLRVEQLLQLGWPGEQFQTNGDYIARVEEMCRCPGNYYKLH